MSNSQEEDIGPAKEWWEAAGQSDAERELLRKAYELGRASINGDNKKATLAELQRMYDAATDKAEHDRLRNAFAAGSQIEYKKMSHNQKAARGPRAIWESECAAIAKPPCFMHIPTGDALNDKAFVKKYGYLSKSKSVLGKANTSKSMARYHGLTYRPPRDFHETVRRAIEVTEQGDNGPVTVEHYNTYKSNALEPLRDGRAPDVFLEHMRYLVPDLRERKMLADWLADLIQHPGQKRMFAILLIGPGGTGKSWLADLLRVILGRHNVSTPRSSTLKRDFNGWAGEKTLALVHELKGTGITAENLQDIITQPTLEINRKGIEAIELPSFISLFLISNHDDCLPMDDETRRYLVIQCAKVPNGALDKPSGRRAYTITPEMTDYYGRLFGPEGQPTEPSENGIDPSPTDETRRVLAWLQDRKISLDCRSVAPTTKAKSKVVDAGRTSLASLMVAAFRDKEPPFNGDVFAATDVLNDIDEGKELNGVERSLARVTAELRKLGCEQISEQNIRTAYGRRYLWALTAADAVRLRKAERKWLARRYLALRLKGKEDDENARAEADADAKAHAAEAAE